MKVIGDFFFFVVVVLLLLLLRLLLSGAFAEGSEDTTTHSLPFHPAFQLQISKFDRVPSPHRMLFPQTEPEFLDKIMYGRDVVTPMTTVQTINPSSATTTTPTYNPMPMSQRDVVTPMTTVPTINPSSPTTTTPTYNPLPTPANPTPTTNPYTTPTNSYATPTMGSPTSPTPTMGNPTSPSGQSWCVASPSASQTALQVALDYACGYGGVDCSAIQKGGSCFNPDTVRDHASYAFNSYYQKNPVRTSCDFGGAAIITNTDPSTSTCKYPSSSTSSSTLNTTNPTGGGSPVYGSSPFGTSPPGYTNTNSSSINTSSSFTLICFLISLVYLNVYK